MTNEMPYTDIPTLIAPDASKSKFRFLLNWRKLPASMSRPSTRAGGDQLSTSTINEPSRPALSSRSFSANVAAVSPTQDSDQNASRRDKVLIDPPPYAQAPPLAILHADLETPTSFSEKPRSRLQNDQFKDLVAADLVDDRIEVKKSHKRTESGQSTCSVKSKHFFLINGPYMLQYDSDSEGSTLPEKILVLRRDSVAFASDAVPGHPWVLQISRASALNGKSSPSTLRPSWSRMTLRQNDNKRVANTLLLIFNESDELYTWLYAIKKEIEHLGGGQYRPATSNSDKEWRDSLTRKFAAGNTNLASPPSMKRNKSRSASPLITTTSERPTTGQKTRNPRPDSHESSTHSFKLAPVTTNPSRSSTLSTCQNSRPTTSNGELTLSPIQSVPQRPPNDMTNTDSSHGNLLLRGYSDTVTPQSARSSTISTPRGSILERRRKLSLGSLQVTSADSRARKCLPSLPSTITASPDGPTTPPILSPAKSLLSESTTPLDSPVIDFSALEQTTTSEIPATSLPSKPKYSLFPTTTIPESKPVPVTSPPAVVVNPSSRPATRQGSIEIEKQQKLLRSHGKGSVQLDHQRTRSRTVTLELRQHRFSTLLGVGATNYDLPQRSPAVTDDMIMFGFGVREDSPPSSPMPPPPVPSLADLNLDLKFLRSEYKPEPRKSSISIEQRKSLPRKNSASIKADVPTGPPPSGPLPAIPTIPTIPTIPAIPADSRRSSRTTRSSQYSQYSQFSHLSHASSMTSYSYASLGSRLGRDSTEVKNKLTELGEPLSLSNIVLPQTSKPNHRHKRTISNPLDGPAPPARLSINSTSVEHSAKPRSRSRKRI